VEREGGIVLELIEIGMIVEREGKVAYQAGQKAV